MTMSSKCVSRPVTRALLLLWALGLTAALPTAATVTQEQAIEDLVPSAPVIVTATCRSSRSFWLGRLLVTETELTVEEVLKGAPSLPVRVVLPGGSDTSRQPAIGMVVPGAPHLPPGSRFLLYLKPLAEPAGTFTVVGLSDGALPLPGDASTTWAGSLLARIRERVAELAASPAASATLEER
jgi:hypothetical protein